ncbi:hypothetical protein BH11PLA2_BH11PLA2_45910 [soil metagenome]
MNSLHDDDDRNSEQDMIRVAATHPCPVCKKPDWCLTREDDSAAICSRLESPKRCGEAGWLHILRESPRAVLKPKPSWEAMAAEYAAKLPDTSTLSLGLPPNAFDVIPMIGWNPAETCHTFPEVNETGIVIGIVRRFLNGSKKSMHGGKRGLTLPKDWRNIPGPAFVVEGPTDVAAMIAAGQCAVGRPSNTSFKFLPELFTDWPADRAIVVVGENDIKPNGDHPGAVGMNAVAKALATALQRTVLKVLPPPESKDVRAWLIEPARGETSWPERGCQLAEYLLKNASPMVPGEDRRKKTREREGIADAARSGIADGIKIDPKTDIANGMAFAREHHTKARYAAEKGWLSWTGKLWEHDDRGELDMMAKQTAGRLLSKATIAFNNAKSKEEQDYAESLIKHALQTQSAGGLKNMLRMAQSEVPIPAKLEDFDRLPSAAFLLNCPNGTLDLRTGTLRDHCREEMLTTICSTDYDPAAKSPTWEKFLDAIFAADAELIRWVQRWLGYILSGDTSIHILPVLCGAGSNGKSVFIEVIIAILGRCFAGKMAPNLLLVKRGEAHPTELADLLGKRLVVMTETAEGARLDESLLKELTGGDRIKARYMRQDFFEFDPTHKVCMVTNHRPKVREGGHGTWRRIKLIPFNVQFWAEGDAEGPAELKADKGLKAKLLAEAAGILAWMVHGWLELQAHGMELGNPDAVKTATREYEEAEDAVGRFIAERLTMDRNAEEKTSAVYGAYMKWHADEGDDLPLNRTQFGLRIKAKGIRKRNSGGKFYSGIKLNQGESNEVPTQVEPVEPVCPEMQVERDYTRVWETNPQNGGELVQPVQHDGESGQTAPARPSPPPKERSKVPVPIPASIWPNVVDTSAIFA